MWQRILQELSENCLLFIFFFFLVGEEALDCNGENVAMIAFKYSHDEIYRSLDSLSISVSLFFSHFRFCAKRKVYWFYNDV